MSLKKVTKELKSMTMPKRSQNQCKLFPQKRSAGKGLISIQEAVLLAGISLSKYLYIDTSEFVNRLQWTRHWEACL